MAAKSKAEKDQLRRDTETLLLNPFPVSGDLRCPRYKAIVNEAVIVLWKRMFEDKKKAPWHAYCCQNWGEKASLAAKNHYGYMMVKARDSDGLNIKDSQDLFKSIVGEEPEDEKAPWTVQFPRTTVDCNGAKRDETNWHQRNLPAPIQLVWIEEETLGKRYSMNLSLTTDSMEADETRSKLV